MKKVIILGIMTIVFTGANLNKTTPVMKVYEKQVQDTSTIDSIPDKLHKLDSLLLEINKLEYEKE